MLAHQVSLLSSEKEQLYAALQTKHQVELLVPLLLSLLVLSPLLLSSLTLLQEAVMFHAEATRLAALVKQANENQSGNKSSNQELEQLRSEYTARKQQVSCHYLCYQSESNLSHQRNVCHCFQLVEVQDQLSQYKLRCSDLTAQLESSSSDSTVPLAMYDKLRTDLDDSKKRLERQKEALLEKDKQFASIQMRVTEQEETNSLLKAECSGLRKQVCYYGNAIHCIVLTKVLSQPDALFHIRLRTWCSNCRRRGPASRIAENPVQSWKASCRRGTPQSGHCKLQNYSYSSS